MPFLLRSQQRRSSEGNSTEGPLLLFHINEKNKCTQSIRIRNRCHCAYCYQLLYDAFSVSQMPPTEASELKDRFVFSTLPLPLRLPLQYAYLVPHLVLLSEPVSEPVGSGGPAAGP